MKKIIVTCLSVLFVLVYLVTIYPLQSSQAMAGVPAASAGVSKAWLDAPLDGKQLPLAPYEVVYHGADLSGVARMELSINGNQVSLEDNPNQSKLLVTSKYAWKPQAPGKYTLRARAQNNAGGWSEYAIANVTILGTITDTPTPTPTMTITPTITTSPTPTNTPTPTPTTFAKLQLLDPTRSVGTFYHGSCTPNEITFTIRASDPKAVQYLFLFYKMQDMDSEQITESNDGQNMQKVGNDTWSITLKYTQIPNYNRFSRAWFIYQFISQGPNKEITRGKQYTDVQFLGCSGESKPAPKPGSKAPTPFYFDLDESPLD